MRRSLAAAVLIWGWVAGARMVGAPGAEPPLARVLIRVSAETSLRGVMAQIAAKFQKTYPGSEVRLDLGSSTEIAHRILDGAPADVFISADPASLRGVAKAGGLAPTSRTDLLTNAVVAVATLRSTFRISTVSDLASPDLKKVALCVETDPVGSSARSWLRGRGVLASMVERIVPAEDSQAALALVETGSADLAFVYLTDAKRSVRVRIVYRIPLQEGGRIAYAASALAAGGNPAGGREFLEFLGSPIARYIFESAGFVTLQGP